MNHNLLGGGGFQVFFEISIPKIGEDIPT